MSLSLADTMATLAADSHLLPVGDRAFALSLVESYQTRGRLSDKQFYWATKFVARIASPPAPAGASVNGLRGVVELFDAAIRSKLQYPKIRFDTESAGAALVLSRAGAAARFPGSVNCTDGKPYGQGVWYGRISRDGTFAAGRDCPDALIGFLASLASNPAATAAAYGQRTGSCCFCARQLTDSRSVSVGYGPICAAHYGLPWGNVDTTAA